MGVPGRRNHCTKERGQELAQGFRRAEKLVRLQLAVWGTLLGDADCSRIQGP
jgi:hypothetical protein